MAAVRFLRLEEQLVLLRELLALFDRAEEFEAELNRRGFDSFSAVYRRNAEGFSDAEIELDRRIRQESAKQNVFAWPHYSWASGHYHQVYEQHGYHSALLKRVKAERDVLNERECPGVPFSRLPHWRQTIGPIARYYSKLDEDDRAVSCRRRNARLAASILYRQTEAKRHATELSSMLEFNQQGCRDLYAEVMLRNANALGFRHDPRRSGKVKLFFSKSLTPVWDICFLLEELVCWDGGGVFKMILVVIPQNAKARPRCHENGDFMFVEFWQVAPFFRNTYGTFSSLAELETSVKAYLALYELEMPILEGLLARLLPKS